MMKSKLITQHNLYSRSFREKVKGGYDEGGHDDKDDEDSKGNVTTMEAKVKMWTAPMASHARPVTLTYYKSSQNLHMAFWVMSTTPDGQMLLPR